MPVMYTIKHLTAKVVDFNVNKIKQITLGNMEKTLKMTNKINKGRSKMFR